MTTPPRKRMPRWFAITAAVSFIPVLCWPWLISQSDALNDPASIANLLLLTFPIYAVLSIYLAYRCIGERTYLAVLLIVMLWLSFGAMWLL